MPPQIDLFASVFLIGAAQAVFLALLLFMPGRGNRYANRFLGCFLLLFALGLSDEFLFYTRWYQAMPWLLGIIWPLDFLYGPLFYFYARALMRPADRWSWRRLWHLLPLLPGYLACLPYMASTAEEKLTLVFAPPEQPTWQQGLLSLNSVLAMIQILVYLLRVVVLLRRHAALIDDTLSWHEGADLRWLRHMTVACIILWGLYVTRDLLLPLSTGVAGVAYWVLPTAIAGAIYLLGLLALRQPRLFFAATEPVHAPVVATTAGKYQKSALTPAAAGGLFARLEELMQNDKPYSDSDLTLASLARKLAVSPHHLSQAINMCGECSFFDYVNSYRVGEAMRLLADPAETRSSILALSLQAGFKSKSAFYNAFRHHTGMTPTQYRAAPTPLPEVSGPSR